MNSNNLNVTTVMIIEVLGKPKEHLIETLKKMIKNLEEEKGVEVVSNKIREPVPLRDQEGFFTSFAEVEVKTETINILSELMFRYMPANIEIISPESITMNNNGWNDILNEITRRLHQYDELARAVSFEKNILENKLKALLSKKPEEKN